MADDHPSYSEYVDPILDFASRGINESEKPDLIQEAADYSQWLSEQNRMFGEYSARVQREIAEEEEAEEIFKDQLYLYGEYYIRLCEQEDEEGMD